jgi:hypothetical protein
MSMNLFEILNVSSRSVIALPKTVIVVCLLSCLGGTGCPPLSMSAECRDFFLRPSSEREKLFPTYDLDKQLDLYRCGMNRRPPDSSLPLFIAERGEAAIPTLLDKLEAEKDELFQYGIIDIFEVMSVKGYLRDRRDVINRIRQVVAKMKVSTFREMAQKDLSQIEKNSFG